MLQRIRGATRGKAAYVIVALMALPLAILGFDWFRPGIKGAIAEVNGEDIGSKEFNQQVAVERQRVLAEMEGNADIGDIDEQALANRALRVLVQRRILLQQTEHKGMDMPAQVVDREILKRGEFLQEGVFSPQRYQAALRQSGYNPGQFKDTVREELLVRQLMSPLAEATFILPQELDRIVDIREQRRTVRYFTVLLEDWSAKISVSEEEAQLYYDERSDIFFTDEVMEVGYFYMQREEFYGEVSEEDLRAYYEDEVYALEEQRYVAHILLEIKPERDAAQTLSELQEIHAQLQEGADFAALAQRYSDDVGSASAGGELGLDDGEIFPAAFTQALAALAPGALSEPVRTEAGWHLLRRLEVPLPPYEERRDTILQAVRRILSETPYQAHLEATAETLFHDAALNKVSKPRGYKITRSGLFTVGEGEGILALPRVQERLADPDFRHGLSQVIQLDKDTAVAMRILNHLESRPKEFEEARAEIIETLALARAAEEIEEEVPRIVDALRSGARSLPEIADANGYAWHVLSEVQRTDADLDVPPRLLDQAFHLPRPAADKPSAGTVELPEEGHAILQVMEVQDGTREEYGGEDRRRLAERMTRDSSGILSSIYQNSLNVAAEVEVN